MAESKSWEYHHSCPLCDVQFIGFTDADMIEHLVSEHPEHAKRLASVLGLNKKYVTCDNCGKGYVTYMGECPWCSHGDPPYE